MSSAPGPRRQTPANLIYRTLDRALAACGLSPCESLLMQIARERSYALAKIQGLEDAIPFTLNISHIAGLWGMSRRGLQKAIRRLETAEIIQAHPEGLWINKYHRTWKPPHRLTDRQIHAVEDYRISEPPRTIVLGALRTIVRSNEERSFAVQANDRSHQTRTIVRTNEERSFAAGPAAIEERAPGFENGERIESFFERESGTNKSEISPFEEEPE